MVSFSKNLEIDWKAAWNEVFHSFYWMNQLDEFISFTKSLTHSLTHLWSERVRNFVANTWANTWSYIICENFWNLERHVFFFFSSRSFLTARRSKGTGLFYWAASRHRLFLYWPVSRCAFGREGISPDLPLPGWEATARLSWAGLGEEVA